jgi:hypothetical protein
VVVEVEVRVEAEVRVQQVRSSRVSSSGIMPIRTGGIGHQTPATRSHTHVWFWPSISDSIIEHVHALAPSPSVHTLNEHDEILKSLLSEFCHNKHHISNSQKVADTKCTQIVTGFCVIHRERWRIIHHFRELKEK